MVTNVPTYTDVLIIGGGPGGLMAGQALSRLGIQVKIIDRRGPKEQYGNADGLMSRTLEIWKSYGLYERISSKACPVHMMAGVGWEQGSEGIFRSIPNENVVVPARYRYDFAVAPELIEAALQESMNEAGLCLSYRQSPVSIEYDNSQATETPVKVVLQRLADPIGGPSSNGHKTTLGTKFSDTETVFAKYVIGADGGKSWVRRHFNIDMEGDQTEYFWGAIDVAVETNFPDFRSKCIVQASTGAVIFIPREEDKVRIYVQFSPREATRNANGRLDRVIPFEVACNMVKQKVQEGLKPYTIEFSHIYWCTVFTVSQMVAAKYSVENRIFIVGDACHTHSPKAGQGANAAIGDAHNLAWKIAHVLRKWADPSILQTYEVERRTYAQELISFDKVIAEALDGGTAAKYQSLLHQQNMFTSGIGIKYESTLVRDAGILKGTTYFEAGSRLPPAPVERLADWRPLDLQDLAPSDGLFKIFIFPGDILVEADLLRLQEFCDALMTFPHMANLFGSRVILYTILNSERKKAEWVDVPSLLRDWKRVFVSNESESKNAYRIFGISKEGVSVVVRPDGHISMTAILCRASTQEIASFFLDPQFIN